MTPRVMMVLVLLSAFTAFAQASRTWVSGVGDDANPCSRTAPCKTFAGTISKTATGGEITVLDPGGFGAVNITKSITINADGLTAGVVAPGVNGISVNAAATDVVVLRGLDFTGMGTGLCGVNIVTAGAVHIENSIISGFTTGGICLAGTAGTERLFVKNVSINETKNGTTPTAPAILISGGTAVVDHARLHNNDIGISVSGSGKLTLVSSNVSGNTDSGVVTTGSASASIERTTFASNGTGVNAGTGTTARVSDSIFSFNTTGMTGTVTSFGNNRLSAGNGTDGAPTATLPQQ